MQGIYETCIRTREPEDAQRYKVTNIDGKTDSCRLTSNSAPSHDLYIPHLRQFQIASHYKCEGVGNGGVAELQIFIRDENV